MFSSGFFPPFDRVIELGILASGQYQVYQEGSGAKVGSIDVRVSTTADPDDHLYAPISQALFRQKGGSNEIFLTGDFPNSCMKMAEVRVDVQSKVIVVQPIAEMESLATCTPGKYPFSRVVNAGAVPPGRYLLHVRSMNAKAFNNLVDVK